MQYYDVIHLVLFQKMDKESIEKDLFTDLFRKIDKNIVAKESGNNITYNKHDANNQIEDISDSELLDGFLEGFNANDDEQHFFEKSSQPSQNFMLYIKISGLFLLFSLIFYQIMYLWKIKKSLRFLEIIYLLFFCLKTW